MQRLIVIRGYPGSGKTTIGKMLEREGLGKLVDHNAILNFITSFTGDDTELQDDIHLLETAMTRKLLTDKVSAIVARGFSKKMSIDQYVNVATQAGAESIVFRLSAPLDILESRVISPERTKDFNPTITSEALREWVKLNPQEEYSGEHIIDATKPISEVISSIKAHF